MFSYSPRRGRSQTARYGPRGGRGPSSGWRGYGREGYPLTSQISLPSKPFGSVVDTIDIKTLLIEEDTPKIQDVEYIASYNWLDSKSPVILVPGSPPAWTPPAIDPQLKPDSEPVFRDINAAKYSSYPLEPMMRSVRTMKPDFDLRAVDIVGCGGTFGNLLRFAGSQPKPFRFDVDLIGDTLLFVRKERSPTELITDLQGYGHTFPDAYTTWDAGVKNSCSHQRIIRYMFGGLHLMVRSETDGYVKQPGVETPLNIQGSKNQSSVEDALSTMAVTSSSPSDDSKLQLKMAGKKVLQDQIFDIKTRAGNRIFDMNEILPRLWVNQTPKFLIAYHKFGLFDEPEIEDIREDVTAWEKANSTKLGRFHAILKHILDVIGDSEKKECEVSWDGEGLLQITERIGDGKKALPPDLMRLLEGDDKEPTSLDPSL